jgi:HEAT repeat protein
MAIRFTCPSCEKPYKVPDAFAGHQARCKRCGEVTTVPDVSTREALDVGDSRMEGSTLSDEAVLSPSSFAGDEQAREPFASPMDGESVPLEDVRDIPLAGEGGSGFSRLAESDASLSAVGDFYRTHVRRRGFNWTPAHLPGAGVLEFLLTGAAVLMGLVAFGFTMVGSIFSSGQTVALLVAFGAGWVLLFAFVIPGAITGVYFAGRMLEFELPPHSYLRMYTLIMTLLMIVYGGIALGLVLLAREQAAGLALLAVLVALVISFPLFWLLFPIRFPQAIVSYVLAGILMVLVGGGGQLIIGAAVGLTANQMMAFDSSTEADTPVVADAARSDDEPSEPLTITVPQIGTVQLGGRTPPASSRDEQRGAEDDLRAQVLAKLRQEPPFFENWLATAHRDQALGDPVSFAGGAYAIRPVNAMMVDLRSNQFEVEASAAWMNMSGQPYRRLTAVAINRAKPPSAQAVPWVPTTPEERALARTEPDIFTVTGDAPLTYGRVGEMPWCYTQARVTVGGQPRFRGVFVLLQQPRWIAVTVECDTDDAAAFAQMRAAALSVRPVDASPPPPWLNAPSVAQALVDPASRSRAVAMLREMGQDGASAVLAYAMSDDRAVVMAVLDLLENGKSPQVVAALEQLARHEDNGISDRAKSAWRRASPQPITALDEAIVDIESPVDHRYRDALRLLAVTPPDERRERVVTRLKGLVWISENQSWRGDLAAAIARWTDGQDLMLALKVLGEPMASDQRRRLMDTLRGSIEPEHIPDLIDIFEGERSFHGRDNVIELLAATGDRRAIEALVEGLAERRDREPIARALLEVGPAAEPVLLDMLEHRSDRVRRDVIEVLGRVGGNRSIAALVAVIRSEHNNDLARQARDSIERIRKRLDEQRRLAVQGGEQAPADTDADDGRVIINRYSFIPPRDFELIEQDDQKQRWSWSGPDYRGKTPVLQISVAPRLSLDDDVPRVLTRSGGAMHGQVLAVSGGRTQQLEIDSMRWVRAYRIGGTAYYSAFNGPDWIVIHFKDAEGNNDALEQMEAAVRTFARADPDANGRP